MPRIVLFIVHFAGFSDTFLSSPRRPRHCQVKQRRSFLIKWLLGHFLYVWQSINKRQAFSFRISTHENRRRNHLNDEETFNREKITNRKVKTHFGGMEVRKKSFRNGWCWYGNVSWAAGECEKAELNKKKTFLLCTLHVKVLDLNCTKIIAKPNVKVVSNLVQLRHSEITMQKDVFESLKCNVNI